jgi:N-acylglucosamine-6-phosphate 2-epimerase
VDRERAWTAFQQLSGGLVVSCQANEGNPLRGATFMAAMAKAAQLGGAVGIRAEGAADIAAIREAVGPELPIIGIIKVPLPDGTRSITPDATAALASIQAGANLVALDGTPRRRPTGEQLADIIHTIHEAGSLALADIGTVAHARDAISAGADAVGTTLSGYTPDSPHQDGPDLELVSQLVAQCHVPVFAEGRYWTPEQARAALDAGASFVVVGTAITNSLQITARFVTALRQVNA